MLRRLFTLSTGLILVGACTDVGGADAHFRWLGSVRVLFDFFYPGVLPGDVTFIPPGTDLNADIL